MKITFLASSVLSLMEIGVVWPLRFSWAAGILPILIASLPFASLNRFHGAVLSFAKRGKIMHPSSSHKLTVPQRWFCHFYVVAVPWTAILLVATWSYAYKVAPLTSEPHSYSTTATHLSSGSNLFSWQYTTSTSFNYRYMVWKDVFLLLLMEIQVLRRLYETVYVFDYNPSAQMHILGYITGIFFYTAAPLSLCCNSSLEVYKFSASQMLKYVIRCKSQMQLSEVKFWEVASPLLKLGLFQWIGAAIFLWGWIHQRRCHAILGSLREHKEQSDKYVIPHGDWFNFVSCPHYLAEIVIYGGVLAASGGSEPTIWLLFVFVVANLVFAAAETHRWYLCKFDDYPRSRCAIIPFIY